MMDAHLLANCNIVETELSKAHNNVIMELITAMVNAQ